MPDPVPPPLPPVPLPPSPEDLRRLADLIAQLGRWLADHWMPPLGPPIPVPPPPTPPPAPPGPFADGDTLTAGMGGDTAPGSHSDVTLAAAAPDPLPRPAARVIYERWTWQ